jgi:hypothetical protein
MVSSHVAPLSRYSLAIESYNACKTVLSFLRIHVFHQFYFIFHAFLSCPLLQYESLMGAIHSKYEIPPPPPWFRIGSLPFYLLHT